MLIFLSGFTSLYTKPDKARDYWCPGQIIQIDAQITYTNASGFKRLSFDEVKDEGFVPRGVYEERMKENKTMAYIDENWRDDVKCLRPRRFLYSRQAISFRGHYLFFSIPDESDPVAIKSFEVYNVSNFGKILPSLILHDGIITFSKIQLVVYHQCCILIGWATSRLYVLAH